jgi:Na+/melibiose symporter-like transporter
MKRLPLSTLLIYAAPALPLGMLGLPLLVILPTFWAGPMHMKLATVGLVLTLVRVIDAIVDPTIGRLSDLSRSRFGRRKPFIALAIPLAATGAIGLFFPPHNAGVAWLFIFNAMITWGWTMLSLPYWAWGAELSDDYAERQRITSFREGGSIVGILLSAIAPVVLGITDPAGEAHLLVILTLGLATPFVLMALIAVPDKLPSESAKPVKLGAALRLAARNKPFRTLIVTWLLNGLANGLPATLFLLVCTHILGDSKASGPVLLVYFAAGVFSVPIWLKLAVAIGKHRAWIVALIGTAVAFSFAPLLPLYGVGLFMVISLFTGAGLGADFTLPPSIQADVIDLDEFESGEHRAGLFFAASTMAQKAGNALSVGIAFPLLQLAGFNANGSNGFFQKAVLLTLYCLVPSALKLGCSLLLRGFPIDRAAQAELRQGIAAAGI